MLAIPIKNIFWFFLNPFIIIELTGNLHFEGVMLFFLLWALYLLLRHKWLLSAVVFALSISVKLLPLLFLPMFFHYFRKTSRLGLKRLLKFYGITALVCLFSFLPFLTSGVMNNYLATTALWFQKFEFNASIYYLVRWLGFQVKGYNIIGTSGMVLGMVVVMAVLIIAWIIWKREKTAGAELKLQINGLLWGILIYYFLATTIHPWYLGLPLILCIFTRFRFPFVWVLAAYLSYSAYSVYPAEENLWLVALEYLLVFGFLAYEVIPQLKRKSSFPS